MSIILASLVSVLGVSLVSLMGALALRVEPMRLERNAALLISFAVGALLGDVFIHLLPESFAEVRTGAELSQRSLLVLGGFLGFFLVETALRRRSTPDLRPPLAAINLIGDSVHNFIDGSLIAASYLASPTLGVSTTVAVLLHEVPQELGDFAVLIHAGLSVRRALWMNVLSASTAVLGAIATLLLGGLVYSQLTAALIPITAGGFLYIAAAVLIPELQREQQQARVLAQVVLIALGVALMAAVAAWE